MIRVVLEDQRLLLNNGVALLANVLAQAAGFLAVVTRATQMPATEARREGEHVERTFRAFFEDKKKRKCASISILPAGIFDEAHVCKHSLANITAEAVGMPAIVHGLDYTANDELP